MKIIKSTNHFYFYKKGLLFLFCFVLTNGFSQTFNSSIFFGINQSRTAMTHWGFDKTGVILGLGTEFAFNKRTSLEFNLQYDQKGFIFYDTLVHYRLHLNYVVTPFILNYFYRNLQLSIGGSYGKLLSVTEDTTINSFSRLPLLTKADYSYILAIGYFLSPNFQIKLFLVHSINPITIYHDQNSLFSFRLIYFLKKHSNYYSLTNSNSS